MPNTRLEEISDKIRMGHPVGILEALEAIEYQEGLKRGKKIPAWKRVLNWLKGE